MKNVKEKIPSSSNKAQGNAYDNILIKGNNRRINPPQIQLKVDSKNNSKNSKLENSNSELTSGSKSFAPFQLKDNEKNNSSNLPENIKQNTEQLSGFSLDDVNVHYNSPKPAQLNAHAYAQGNNIHVATGQEHHLAHEAWHVVQQKQGIVKPTAQLKSLENINDDPTLENEADKMALKINAGKSSIDTLAHLNQNKTNFNAAPVQRQVRISGGSKKVDEKKYQPGGAKETVGSKHSVSGLIADGVKRVFTSESELDNYANGATDYIGDVKTAKAGTYWYRLPHNKLTVLGEYHHNPDGNVPDVINGFGTSRFKYEPFNEMENIGAISDPHTSTNNRIDDIDKKSEVAGNVDKVKFNPGMENIVLKAMTGCGLLRNEFIAGNPKSMSAADVKKWSGRPTTADYSIGERTALYFTMAIHIAKDVSNENFGPETFVERGVITAARNLQTYYRKFQFFFDTLMNWKDGDELIGIYELTKILNFLLLPVYEKFSELFHIYGAQYVQELGAESGNKALTKEGAKLEGNLGAKLSDFSPAREEVIWNKVMEAKSGGYLLAGMGDAHHRNLTKRLNKEGIPHEEVTDSLERQKKKNKAKWKK